MHFNEEKIIKNKLIIQSNKEDNREKCLNIAYGVDKNFLLGCAISITSILAANTNISLKFHIFTTYFDDEYEAKFRLLSKHFDTSITIYLIDDENFSSLPTNKNWTLAIYYRFIIADYFYNKLDKILYLDADIICINPLSDLIDLNIDTCTVAAVKDKDENWWNKCAERLNEQQLSLGYFNSGFLLINVNQWHKNQINTKSLAKFDDPQLKDKITHFDQDILNLVLYNQIKYLDNKYNQQVNINYELKYKTGMQFTPVLERTILIHYIGPTKPWHLWAKGYDVSNYFFNIKNSSPWETTPLLTPKTAAQLRYCSKHTFHKKQIFLGMVYYIRYSFKKIMKIFN